MWWPLVVKIPAGLLGSLIIICNCMVSGHVLCVCVTVISVCLLNLCVLNSWFRPGMPHRLSGPRVFMGKLWLAILRCCAQSFWVRTLFWLVASIECLISQVSESYGFKRKDVCEFDMRCEKREPNLCFRAWQGKANPTPLNSTWDGRMNTVGL